MLAWCAELLNYWPIVVTNQTWVFDNQGHLKVVRTKLELELTLFSFLSLSSHFLFLIGHQPSFKMSLTNLVMNVLIHQVFVYIQRCLQLFSNNHPTIFQIVPRVLNFPPSFISQFIDQLGAITVFSFMTFLCANRISGHFESKCLIYFA